MLSQSIDNALQRQLELWGKLGRPRSPEARADQWASMQEDEATLGRTIAEELQGEVMSSSAPQVRPNLPPSLPLPGRSLRR